MRNVPIISCNGIRWNENYIYAEIPNDNGGVIVASVDTQSIQDIIKGLDERVEEVKVAILNRMGFDPETMTEEDWEMVGLGITVRLVESVMPEDSIINPIFNKDSVKELIFIIRQEDEPVDNYYYMKSKVNTEYAVWISSMITQAGSYTAAAGLFASAGIGQSERPLIGVYVVNANGDSQQNIKRFDNTFRI